jgi:hypothetical protein
MWVHFNGNVTMNCTREGGCGTHGKGKGKGKGVPVDAIKAYMGSRGRPIAPLSGSEWSVSRPSLFTPSRYPLNRSLDGSQRRSRRFGEDRNPLPYRDSNSGPPARSPVATPTVVSRLPLNK